MRALAIALLVAGCDINDVHTCATDDDCVLAGTTGRCEPTGYCSFADGTCGAQGFRYHEHTGDHANICVVPGVAPSEVDAFDLAAAADTTRTSCGGEHTRDAYVEINSTMPQVLFIDTAVTNTDTPVAIAVRSGACPGTTELGCDVRRCGDVPYSMLATLIGVGTFCIVVEEATAQAELTHVGLRVVPAGRIGQPLQPSMPLQTTTCDMPNNQASLLFGACPGGLHVGATVDPDDTDGVDVGLSLHYILPQVNPVVPGVNNVTGTNPESLDATLADPGLYWLLVDRVGGSTCGRITVGFNITP